LSSETGDGCQITVFYYKLCNDLGHLTIPDMIKSSRNPEEFNRQSFHPLLEQSLASKLGIRYLNQISGPSFTCWDVNPSIEIEDGVEYHQCRLGPDQGSNRLMIFKELEADVSLTNPQYNTWKHHDDYFIESCNDSLAQLCSHKSYHNSMGAGHVLLIHCYNKHMENICGCLYHCALHADSISD